VSLLQAGCFFGALLAAPIGDKWGRKKVLLATGIVFCLGSAMQTASHGIKGLLYAGRAIGGLVGLTIEVTLWTSLTVSGRRIREHDRASLYL
jgi:MFS family permease